MRWEGERQSENVEDRRSISAGKIAMGGGLGTILIVLLASFLTGADPRVLMQRFGAQPARQQAPAAVDPKEDRQAALVKTTLALTEDV
ncbi:MAG TPA: neutral zinc metallopeptidase, partial [Isosphaeraceae bacterium]|nr:neutral zinc metallopeptidase [Isosphaeraceae bacterium]